MELHNQIAYTKKDRLHMLYFGSFRLFRRLGLWNLPITVFFTLVGVVALYQYFSGGIAAEPPFLGGIILVAGLTATLTGGLILFLTAVVLFGKDQNTNVYFSFFDELFETKIVSDVGETSLDVKYNDITKAYETKRYFYIFINQKQCVCVVKSGFSDEGAALLLRDKLASVLGVRFQRFCRKEVRDARR